MLTRSDKLLKAETWETMYTPTDYFGDTEMAKNYHGLWGVYYAVPTVGHIGRTSGCSSYLMLDLQDGIGSVVMSNQGNESVSGFRHCRLRWRTVFWRCLRRDWYLRCCRSWQDWR